MNSLKFGCTLLSILMAIGVQAKEILDCDFYDTVNITSGFRTVDGSYRFENLTIPASLTGEYDYVIEHDGDKSSVAKHMRGCVCKLRSCIRFCCPKEKRMRSSQCSKKENALSYNMTMDIMQHDGTLVWKHILREMFVQEDLPLPCNDHYILDRNSPEDQWTLFENGTLLRHYDTRYLSKQEYCLQPQKMNNGTHHNYTIVPHNCIIEPSMSMAYVKSVSVIFMTITVALYLWLPRFRSLHGKCCNLYFICLAATFLLNVFSMFDVFSYSSVLCRINGYAGYFAVMATFLWLSVISFDVWRRFALRRFHEFNRNRRSSFLNYNITVWSTASLLTLGIFLVDVFVKFNPQNSISPGVGEYMCWMYTDGWSAMYYFYSPLSVLILFNGIMFALTTKYIYVENKGNQQVLNQNERQRECRNQANYRVYLRLFVIMGGTWFLEIIAFVCYMERVLENFITVVDIVNCSQGIIIFVATFCNWDILKSIHKRIQDRNSTSTDFTSTSRTQESDKLGNTERN
ncbi:probable G-protein coupled receptor Mth-like 11 [Drosophila subobscura]|uniref:probable G-protein coupled receptor Mth-like 11 n=1 Tax=Drosophila subobscura TaxID=7241 RepID=UPI00155B3B83|nr:probable G-protein coupled receptor Mth-like 11 [Drosophila subobscura]